MRPSFLIMSCVLLLCGSMASAAEKTVHDAQNGFSLTYPAELSNEPVAGEAMRLTAKADDISIACVVSISVYNAPSSDPRAFIERGWSPETWKRLIGTAYSTADFSNERLAQFPDGYPVRLTDIDFTLGDKTPALHGHSKIALSIRGSRLGYINCSATGNSKENVLARWLWLIGPTERVVRSFVLDPP